MRKFYITKDPSDDRYLWDLSDQHMFLSEPEGLGVAYNNQYADIGNGFFLNISDKVSQNTISGKLNFITNPYIMYNRFTNGFLGGDKKLYFVYSPVGTLEHKFYTHVEIESIEKKEINKYGYLECPIAFKMLSPWYDPTEIKRHHLNAGSSDPVVVYGAGHFPSSVIIRLTGTAASPFDIVLTGQETEIEYGRCSFTTAFSNTTVELSTQYDDSYVAKVDASGKKTDLISKIDITKNPFFRIPLSEPCQLWIDMSAHDFYADVEVYTYYRTV